MSKAIVSTSANPFHFGHLDIFNKAEQIFGKGNVKVVVAQNSDKKDSVKEQIWFHMNAYKIPFEVISGQMIADYCKQNNITHIVRGIRNGVDAEYELKLDFANREINKDVQTVFIPTDDTFSNLSSSTIREFLKYDKIDVVKKYMNEDALYRYVERCPKYSCFFGQSCCGKTTYLKNKNFYTIDVDKFIWEVMTELYGESTTNNYKVICRDLFEQSQFELFKEQINELPRHFWDVFFANVEQKIASVKWYKTETTCNFNNVGLDWAAVGNYWSVIPIEYRSRMQMVKFDCDDHTREMFIEKKGFQSKIKKLDTMYTDPPIIDQRVFTVVTKNDD